MTKSYYTPKLEQIVEGLECEILDMDAFAKDLPDKLESKLIGYEKVKPYFKPHTLTAIQAEMYHLNPSQIKGNIRVEDKKNYTSFLDSWANGGNGY